jgi:plastocyanin
MFRKLLVVLGVCAAASPLIFPLMAIAQARSAPAQTSVGTMCANPCNVQAQDNVFVPKMVTVTAGTVVNFTNSGQAAHTATSDSTSDATFDSGNLNPGQSYQFTVPTSLSTNGGYIPYHCTYHVSLGMVGTIVVLNASKQPPASPLASPSPAATTDGLPSPVALPTPVPSQKYFPKIGGALLVILLAGIAFGYLKTKKKLADRG